MILLLVADMNTIVIGGGQAGIALSYFLKQYHVEHLVLERDRAFSAWYNRWDSFRLNTANWMNVLPGMEGAFVPKKKWYDVATRNEALDVFEDYVKVVDPPLKEGVAVRQVVEGEGVWEVETEAETYRASNVVICTGYNFREFVPDVSDELPELVVQLHSSAYRNPEQITTANVLIVGSGSSGVQICENLAQSEKFGKVFFAVSNNAVIPWSVLGIPIGALVRSLPVFEIRRNSWLGRRIVQHWYRGDPAMAPSPRWLSENYGVELVGRVTDLGDGGIVCADGKIVPVNELTVIWCTGFRPDYGFVQAKHPAVVFDEMGPIHERGVSTGVSGLFFVGLKLQHTVGSHLLRGVGRDAEYVARKILEAARGQGRIVDRNFGR